MNSTINSHTVAPDTEDKKSLKIVESASEELDQVETLNPTKMEVKEEVSPASEFEEKVVSLNKKAME